MEEVDEKPPLAQRPQQLTRCLPFPRTISSALGSWCPPCPNKWAPQFCTGSLNATKEASQCPIVWEKGQNIFTLLQSRSQGKPEENGTLLFQPGQGWVAASLDTACSNVALFAFMQKQAREGVKSLRLLTEDESMSFLSSLLSCYSPS